MTNSSAGASKTSPGLSRLQQPIRIFVALQLRLSTISVLLSGRRTDPLYVICNACFVCPEKVVEIIIRRVQSSLSTSCAKMTSKKVSLHPKTYNAFLGNSHLFLLGNYNSECPFFSPSSGPVRFLRPAAVLLRERRRRRRDRQFVVGPLHPGRRDALLRLRGKLQHLQAKGGRSEKENVFCFIATFRCDERFVARRENTPFLQQNSF